MTIRREGVDRDRLADRNQGGPKTALQKAPQDLLPKAVGQRAAQQGNRVAGNCRKEDASAPKTA